MMRRMAKSMGYGVGRQHIQTFDLVVFVLLVGGRPVAVMSRNQLVMSLLASVGLLPVLGVRKTFRLLL